MRYKWCLSWILLTLVLSVAGCGTNVVSSSPPAPFAVTPPYLATELTRTAATRVFMITSSAVLPSGTPSVVVTQAALAATARWQTFGGNGYTLIYPPDWYVYQSPSNAIERSGLRYDLILSNASGNHSPQSATPDESARVTVFFLPKPQQPLAEWVMERWAWLDVPLVSMTVEDVPVLMATALLTEPPVWMEFYWIEYRGRYYTVQAYARRDVPDVLEQIKKVMDSFKLKE